MLPCCLLTLGSQCCKLRLAVALLPHGTPTTLRPWPSSLQVPEEEALQFGVVQEPPSENGSHTSRRYSPGSLIREAANWMGLSRTPRQRSDGGRMSVDPRARAAADAKYVTTQQQVERGDSGKVGAARVPWERGMPVMGVPPASGCWVLVERLLWLLSNLFSGCAAASNMGAGLAGERLLWLLSNKYIPTVLLPATWVLGAEDEQGCIGCLPTSFQAVHLHQALAALGLLVLCLLLGLCL